MCSIDQVTQVYFQRCKYSSHLSEVVVVGEIPCIQTHLETFDPPT